MPVLKRGLAGVLTIMENRRKRREQWRIEAKALWDEWCGDPFFVLGVALYWGEGRKCSKSPRFELTNSDSEMLRVWLRWCKRFMPGLPLDYALGIHDTCDLPSALQFWKQQLGIDVHFVSVAVSSASQRKRNVTVHPTFGRSCELARFL